MGRKLDRHRGRNPRIHLAEGPLSLESPSQYQEKRGESDEKGIDKPAGPAAVLAALALKGQVSQDFMTVYTVVIAFYFGTQLERTVQKGGGGA